MGEITIHLFLCLSLPEDLSVLRQDLVKQSDLVSHSTLTHSLSKTIKPSLEDYVLQGGWWHLIFKGENK